MQRFREIGIEDPLQIIDPYMQKQAFLDYESGSITVEQFRKEVTKLTGKDVPLEKLEWAMLGYVGERPKERLDALLELRKKYGVHLLTNTNATVMEFTRSPKFTPEGHSIEYFFDNTFCSHELHVCKPSAEIFLKVLERLGAKAEECVFIDDSMRNIAAAQAVGIHGLLTKEAENWYPALKEYLLELEN